MGKEIQRTAQPAMYAIDPDWIVNEIWRRFEAKFLDMQRDSAIYVRIKEAAEILQMSEASVRRLIEEGKLPAEDYRANGARNAQYRILKSSLAKVG